MARLDDVEFSDNIVSDANITLPAVLHATDGTAWRIHRALFDGNRGGNGGSTLGAVIATEPGANVAMTNVTFTNNTYRPGVVSAHAHAIGVVSTAANPSMMWLFHATMRRPAAMAASEQGSLLRISGAGAYVLLKNSVFDGTCLFNNGGSVMQAEGSIESPGNTCGLDIATNFVGITQNQLRLGALAPARLQARHFHQGIELLVVLGQDRVQARDGAVVSALVGVQAGRQADRLGGLVDRVLARRPERWRAARTMAPASAPACRAAT